MSTLPELNECRTRLKVASARLCWSTSNYIAQPVNFLACLPEVIWGIGKSRNNVKKIVGSPPPAKLPLGLIRIARVSLAHRSERETLSSSSKWVPSFPTSGTNQIKLPPLHNCTRIRPDYHCYGDCAGCPHGPMVGNLGSCGKGYIFFCSF